MPFPHFMHLLCASLLLGAVWCDAIFLRSSSSLILHPSELIAAWRKRVAILEMVLLLIVVGLGVGMWFPRMEAYPTRIFHPKVALAIVALLVGKVRMLKERKSDVPAGALTWALNAAVTAVFCLGAFYGVGGHL